MLAALRKKRQFALVVKVAEAFVRSGQNAPRVRRQYAQALIEQGVLLGFGTRPARIDVRAACGGERGRRSTRTIGRIYKQLYVNTAAPSSRYARLFFERALGEYSDGTRLRPGHYTWHGINAVALMRRGARDGVYTEGPAADEMAAGIVGALPPLSQMREAFDLATYLEALIALDRREEALAAALTYVQHPDADAFEIGSTLRQLEEVWQLSPTRRPARRFSRSCARRS